MSMQTGHPSEDKPWLKYYSNTVKDIGIEIDKKATVWDVIEESFSKHNDVPAIEYFGRVISRNEFKKLVYQWAYIFKNIGVQKDEIVPIYGCLTPDVAAMTFGLNMIGAVPYFLKLAISKEALEEETKEARVAVVFEGMLENVVTEFTKDKYEKVIVYKITDYMKQPQRLIVSLLNKKRNVSCSRTIDVSYAKKQFSGPIENIKAKYEPNKRAFITSSSGTTVGGTVKGTVATNEATIAQLYMAAASGSLCEKGDRALNNLPPTAATSLNVLLCFALFRGATVIIDPRISKDDFYRQLIKYRPNFVLTTGSFWETFFARIERELKTGKKFDFSNVKGWMVGGEGSDPRKYKKWNEILLTNNAPHTMLSGYGCSELFSSVSVDTLTAQSNRDNSMPVMGVGIPFYGLTAGVFDENGVELPYNTRGELWINSASAMQEYYNKPELTRSVLTNGWVHTGDLAQISEEGYLYIWGRTKDCIETPNGKIYNFDVANKIKDSKLIREAIVLPYGTDEDGITKIVAHIEWVENSTEQERKEELGRINENLKGFLPDTVRLYAYAEYDLLPFSPTTLKKDKNALANKKDGFTFV